MPCREAVRAASGCAGRTAAWPTAVEGDRLVFESMAETGARLRFTWDASDATVIKWRNEATTGDGSWFLIEEHPMVPQ
jgi:hypothetical protein